MHLATSLDTKGTMPKLLAMAFSKQPAEQRKAAVSAIQTAQMKGYKIDPNIKKMLKNKCDSNDTITRSLCIKLDNIEITPKK